MTSREERRKQAAHEAEMWLERLERTLRREETASLREWLKVRQHREAIIARCNLWHGPEILAVLATLFPVEMAPKRPSPWLGQTALTIFSAAVWLGLIVMIVTLWSRADETRTPFPTGDVYRTTVGVQRRFLLSDGSSIRLNTASQVLVNVGAKSRDITIVHGEATFDVTEGSARPFRVRAGSRQFECGPGGGRFNIRRLTDSEAELMVIHGSVTALASAERTSVTPAQLRARFSEGEHTFNPSEGGLVGPGWVSPWTLRDEDLQKRLAWQRGRIIFANEMLEDALTEVERYTTARFVFADDELRNLRVSAELRTGDIDPVLRLLRDKLHIELHTDANGRFVLSLSRQP